MYAVLDQNNKLIAVFRYKDDAEDYVNHFADTKEYRVHVEDEYNEHE